MTTHESVIENAPCSKCGKITKEMIYEKQKDNYLCDKCSKKIKFIDTPKLISSFAKSREKLKNSTIRIINNTRNEMEKLRELGDKYKIDEANGELLDNRIQSLRRFGDSIEESFNQILSEDTLIPTEISTEGFNANGKF